MGAGPANGAKGRSPGIATERGKEKSVDLSVASRQGLGQGVTGMNRTSYTSRTWSEEYGVAGRWP